MSEQHEQTEELQYKFNGETHSLVTIRNTADLKKAEDIHAELKSLVGQNSGNKEWLKYQSLCEEQEKRIKDYLERFDTFDNRILNNNINYLTKLNDIKIGSLESYIGLSTGYISRTAKDGAARKLSIESVWKIAKFFDIDIGNLVETDLQEVKGNTFLLMKFINKVIRLTKSGKVQWDSCGGHEYEISQWFIDEKLVTVNDEKKAFYHPEYFDEGEKLCPLYKDIMIAENFSEKGISLLIIPYTIQGAETEKVYYDYFMIYDDPMIAYEKKTKRQKVMYTIEDPYNHLNSLSDKLYSIIIDYQNDARVDTDMHDFLEGFVD